MDDTHEAIVAAATDLIAEVGLPPEFRAGLEEGDDWTFVIKLHALKDRLLLIGFDSKKAEALHMDFLNGLTHGIVPPFAKVPDHLETIPDLLRLVNQ